MNIGRDEEYRQVLDTVDTNTMRGGEGDNLAGFLGGGLIHPAPPLNMPPTDFLKQARCGY